MIWWISFSLFFFLSSKSSFFLSNLWLLDSSRVFMVSIAPLVFLILMPLIFSSFTTKEVANYKSMFFLRIFFVCLTFLFESSFFFLVSLEVSSIPILLLIFNYSKGHDKISALIFMFFINFVGSTPFFYFRILKDSLAHPFFLGPLISFFYFYCFILILCSKVPVFLLHFWLTKAHVRASGSCSILLASLILKLGTFGIYKFSTFFSPICKMLVNTLFSISIVGCLMVTLTMVRFFDIKLLVACSSIVHISLITPFCFVPIVYPICGCLLMMVGHGLVSYLLFYMVTLIYEATINRSYDFMKNFESFSKTLSLFLFLYMFFNLGLPPFINFVRELNFCVGFNMWSKISLITFCFCILVRIIFVIFVLTKGSFGKSLFIGSKIESMGLVVNSVFYFFSLALVLFFYLCPFSLIENITLWK